MRYAAKGKRKNERSHVITSFFYLQYIINSGIKLRKIRLKQTVLQKNCAL